jgi:response regulator RpfG family c-di-GMP phosphodiesterase
MKAIFICDNKEEWENLNRLFSSNFPKVELICALNGEDALEHLSYEGPFAVVMIEASLKENDPSELGNQIIETVGERPIIFMGSSTHIKDRIDNDLYNNHPINGIINTPYDPENFKEVISASLEWAKNEEFEESIEEMDRDDLLPMRIRNFYMFKVVPYDVYLELTTTKFIKIIKRNTPYTHSKIQTYAKKNIKNLFLGKNDFIKMLEDGIAKVTQALLQKGLTNQKYIGNQIRGTLLVQQYIRAIGVSEDIQALCSLIIDTTDKVVRRSQNFNTTLSEIPFKNGDFAEQAILTSYLSEAILHNLGWKSDLSRKKLGLASLLQDSTIGNEDLIKITSSTDPNLQMFTKDEQDDFLTHPIRAAEIARQFQGYSEVDFVIAQHHEKPNGTGFPFGVTVNKLSAHSCTFILATAFVAKYALSNKKYDDKIKILEELKLEYNVGNFKEPFGALEKAIKT